MMTWLGEKIGFGLATSYLRQWEEAKAENARLQDRVESVNRELRRAAFRVRDMRIERDGYKARDKLRGEALPDPDKLRLLAGWFDGDDAAKGRRGPSLATLGGQPPDEVQRELRGWADDIEAAINASPAEGEKEARP